MKTPEAASGEAFRYDEGWGDGELVQLGEQALHAGIREVPAHPFEVVHLDHEEVAGGRGAAGAEDAGGPERPPIVV